MPASIHRLYYCTVATKNPIQLTANGFDKNPLFYASMSMYNWHQILFHIQGFPVHQIHPARTNVLLNQPVVWLPPKNRLPPNLPGHNGNHQYPFLLPNIAWPLSSLFAMKDFYNPA